MVKRTLITILAIFTVSAVMAQAYRWTDENGVVHYSDKPTEGAEQVYLPQSNAGPRSYARPASRATEPAADDSADQTTPFSYDSVEVTAPAPEETFVEHRRRPKRQPECTAGPAAGSSRPRLLRRRSANGDGIELSVAGSLPRSTQHSGGSAGRERAAHGEKPTKPVLRSAELGRQQLDKKSRTPKSPGRRGAGPPGEFDVFESLSTGVIIIDKNLLIETLNPAAENILSISRTRAANQSLLQLLGDDEEILGILSRVIDTGANYATELRLPVTQEHTEERTVECRVAPFLRPGHADGLLVEMSDITRRARISRENALLIQHGAGRQMVRQLAHEIKNPLVGLRGSAQLLERQLEAAELKEYTDVIISETDRLASLVDTLLGPGGPPQKSKVNIHELLEYVMRLVAPLLNNKLRIERDYDPGLPEIELDRDQMVQAFLNLVKNAVSALNGQGRIILRTRAIMNFTIGNKRHPVVASIEIEDDGPGIDAAIKDSIFYPLITGQAEGTGLGLPAAQELISRHEGLIEFVTRPGKTVFQVMIPLETGND